MRLPERRQHYRCTPLQQKLREGTSTVPGPRRCPHPPHRVHPGQRGVMAYGSKPGCRGHLANYRTREGGKEKMLWCCEDVVCICVCNEVWWCPYPTILRPPFHHSPTPEHYFCCARCNLVTLGIRLPLQPQLGGTSP